MARRELETKIIEYPPYVAITHGVKVAVAPAFHPMQSEPSRDLYMFTYTVTIENIGERAVQLLNRHWIVFSGERQCADVKGEGVIGEQPTLLPGEVYRYTSGTSITEPMGMMWGTYTFQSENGEFLYVEIPKFDLICSGLPEALIN
jgi:ApaG protein